jgi:hypothetical protein
MKKLVIAAAMSLGVLTLAAVASADTLVMRDGTRVPGTVVGITGRTITFRDANGTSRRYPTTQVEALEFLSADRANPRAVNSRRLQAPAGTELLVRTVETIDSRQMSSGGATGSPEMVLDVQSITIAGRRYLVSTDDVVLDSDTGVGKNKRTAEAVGGGAVLGGIIGAIAGGGKGAAIGVLVGGAGGAGAQVLTRGRDVQVPAETVLNFRLDKPVMLQADQ